MEYVSQSEARVVAKQIKSRSRQDAAYMAGEVSVTALDSAGGFGVMEDVLCIYMDLDRLIDECGMLAAEREIVDMLMQGYNLADIAEISERGVHTINMIFRSAVSRIVRRNNIVWMNLWQGTGNSGSQQRSAAEKRK